MASRPSTHCFTQASFCFLTRLAINNNHQWFNEHKQEFEETVRLPALAFIADIANVIKFFSIAKPYIRF